MKAKAPTVKTYTQSELESQQRYAWANGYNEGLDAGKLAALKENIFYTALRLTSTDFPRGIEHSLVDLIHAVKLFEEAKGEK